MAEEQKKDQQGAESREEQHSDEQRAKAQEKELAKQIEEMENDHVVDETAATVVYPADVGTSAHALNWITTSPGILAQVRNERKANADPDRHNKEFARDVLGLDVELEDEEEQEGHVWGGDHSDRLKSYKDR